jgi:hypothetical protein
MNDYLVLIHALQSDEPFKAWEEFLEQLARKGHLRGGSSLGPGIALKSMQTEGPAQALGGFLRIAATSMEEARAVCEAIPDAIAGATIEVYPLVQDS